MSELDEWQRYSSSITLCVRYEGGLSFETERELLAECVDNLSFEADPVSIQLVADSVKSRAKSPGHGK